MADEVIYRGYNEEIDVNMVPGGPMSVWHSSQYDELRKLRVNLYNGKALQYLGSGVTVSLSVRKTDGNIIESSSSDVIKIVEENPWGEGSAPWRFIEINTTQQMTACVGKNICEIVVYETVNSETSRIGSANFILEVERDPLAGGIHSDSEIDDLETMVDEEVDALLPTKSINDFSDVDLSYAGEGDFIIRNQSTQKWESRPHYQYKKDLTAGNTTISQTIYLVTEDAGKEFEVFIYGDSYDRPAPTSVNVTLGSGGATVTVEATIPAQDNNSSWLIELVICRGYNSAVTQDKWFLKAQRRLLRQMEDVELTSSYQLHPGKILMLTRLSNPNRFRWQERSLFIDFYDAHYPSQSEYGTTLQAGQSTLVITDDAFKDGYDENSMEYPFMQIYTNKQGLAPYSKVIDGTDGTLTLKFVPQSVDVEVFVRLVMCSPFNYRMYD